MPRPKHLVTPHFGWEYPELGAEANVPEDLHQLLLQVEASLHNLVVSELGTAGVGDAGKLLVVNAGGVASWLKMSGQGSLSSAGVFGINNEAIEQAQIKQLAIGSTRLAEEAVIAAKLGALSVTEAKLAALAVSTGKIAELAVTESKIAALAVSTAKLAELAVTTAKIANGAVTDLKMASPNNSVYHTILQASGVLSTEAAAGTYILGTSIEGRQMALSGGSIIAPNVSIPLPIFTFDSADYKVENKAGRVKLRAQILVNGTKPALTFKVGLYPLTVAGGINEIKVTLGAVALEGTTVNFIEPAASTATAANGVDLELPANGIYALGVVTTAKLTASSAVQISAQLQRRNV